MRVQPANRISEKGLRVWRIYGTFQSLFVLLLAVGVSIANYFLGSYVWVYIVAGAVVVAVAYLLIYLFPKVRWTRWRYEVREQEIEFFTDIAGIRYKQS